MAGGWTMPTRKRTKSKVPLDPASFTELCAKAEAIMSGVVEELSLPAVELPPEMGHYEMVAAFTSESVNQTTNEWGALKVTFKVNGETKWAAMRATDYPGRRLAVVV